MDLNAMDYVDGELLEAAWALYSSSFDELRTRAAQRHVMTRAEFDQVMADKRVRKFAVLDGRVLAGMATCTNDLEAVPLVSPDYYAQRWPAEYADGRIWYVGFLAVAPDYQGGGVASELVRGITESVCVTGGIVGVDICAHNEAALRLPTTLLRAARMWSAGTKLVRLDSQTYWAYDIPAVPAA
jgi:ribosomal protein S18 acetylase RimI-like enzyme